MVLNYAKIPSIVSLTLCTSRSPTEDKSFAICWLLWLSSQAQWRNATITRQIVADPAYRSTGVSWQHPSHFSSKARCNVSGKRRNPRALLFKSWYRAYIGHNNPTSDTVYLTIAVLSTWMDWQQIWPMRKIRSNFNKVLSQEMATKAPWTIFVICKCIHAAVDTMLFQI